MTRIFDLAIEATGLVKTFSGKEAVAGVDLAVPPGGVYGFLGPNGAGKTTTIRMVAGVLQPTAGTITIAGTDLATSPALAKRRIGYIPDRPFLYEKLSGGEFLRFVAALWGIEGPEVEARAQRFLQIFSLANWEDELKRRVKQGFGAHLGFFSTARYDTSVAVTIAGPELIYGRPELDPRKAIDIVLASDGFTAATMDRFRTVVDAFKTQLTTSAASRGNEPFFSFRSVLRIWKIEAPAAV